MQKIPKRKYNLSRWYLEMVTSKPYEKLAIHGGPGIHFGWREIHPRVDVHDFLLREAKKS